MNRRTSAILAVGLVAVLAGCGGFLGSDGTTTPGNTTTATPTNTTTTPGESPYELPLDAATVLDGHESALDDSGSFYYVQNATARELGVGVINYGDRTATVDLSTDELLLRERTAVAPPTDTYLDGTEQGYRRERNETTGTVTEIAAGDVNRTLYSRPPIQRYLTGVNFTHAGSSTDDGTTRHTYTATTVSQIDPETHGVQVVSPSKLESINMTLQIDGEGIIRSIEYNVTGENANGNRLGYRFSIRYEDVGSTTVPEPDWVSRTQDESN